jgi:hypothetical protein
VPRHHHRRRKKLALDQAGATAVGLGGIWNGTKHGKNPGTWELIDDLAEVPWERRRVYVAFDYDPKPETRLETQYARMRLARAHRQAGAARVYEVELPPGPSDSSGSK